MRAVRLAEQPSAVGVDLRATLASWSRGDAVCGGVALLGCRPPGCPDPLDAVVVTPRGVLVVAGVDLPGPALRLEAPLNGAWTCDGWPLITPDTMVNPAVEALQTVAVATELLRALRGIPLPMLTVIAVGPYVEQVQQPAADLNRGIRMLYPEPNALLRVVREFTAGVAPCSVDTARTVIAAMAPDVRIGTEELTAEGFTATVSSSIPESAGTPPQPPSPHPRPVDPDSTRPRWLPAGLAGLLVALLITGALLAVGSTHGSQPANTPGTGTPRPDTDVTLNGRTFIPKASTIDHDCTVHAFGDVRTAMITHPCTELVRRAFQTSVNGRPAAVSVAEVRFANAESAVAVKTVADLPGSGGILDLVAEEKTWSDGPASFNGAAYASMVHGSRVRLCLAVWGDQRSTPDDPALALLANQALHLPLND